MTLPSLVARRLPGAPVGRPPATCIDAGRDRAMAVQAAQTGHRLHGTPSTRPAQPGRGTQQRMVLRDMLSLGRRTPRPGLVVELPYRWRGENYPLITAWSADGAAFEAALAHAVQEALATAGWSRHMHSGAPRASRSAVGNRGLEYSHPGNMAVAAVSPDILLGQHRTQTPRAPTRVSRFAALAA